MVLIRCKTEHFKALKPFSIPSLPLMIVFNLLILKQFEVFTGENSPRCFSQINLRSMKYYNLT